MVNPYPAFLLVGKHDMRILTLSKTLHSYRKGRIFYIGSVSVEKLYPQARVKLPVSGSYLRELEEWKPDIIHSKCELSTFFLAKKISQEGNIPIVHTCHTIYEDDTPYFSPRNNGERRLREDLRGGAGVWSAASLQDGSVFEGSV